MFVLTRFYEDKSTKGQLISKGLVGILNSSKKQTKKLDLQYYDTSGRLVFVRFWKDISKLSDL